MGRTLIASWTARGGIIASIIRRNVHRGERPPYRWTLVQYSPAQLAVPVAAIRFFVEDVVAIRKRVTCPVTQTAQPKR